ncbi:MAG: hypothetical protein ACMVP2_28325 [Imperialibacter sp.]|uniref:hypothetical protein n=1 Tax=Imperialibacter sp. TaxID=2038411 RepID=UPI003A873C62
MRLLPALQHIVTSLIFPDEMKSCTPIPPPPNQKYFNDLGVPPLPPERYHSPDHPFRRQASGHHQSPANAQKAILRAPTMALSLTQGGIR